MNSARWSRCERVDILRWGRGWNYREVRGYGLEEGGFDRLVVVYGKDC